MSVSKGKDLALRASPYVAKVWKVYSYQRGVVHQHLSPFEVNVTSGLFANTLEKIRFKVMVSTSQHQLAELGARAAISPDLVLQDNGWYIAPPALLWFAILSYTMHLRKEYVMSHRH